MWILPFESLLLSVTYQASFEFKCRTDAFVCPVIPSGKTILQQQGREQVPGNCTTAASSCMRYSSACSILMCSARHIMLHNCSSIIQQWTHFCGTQKPMLTMFGTCHDGTADAKVSSTSPSSLLLSLLLSSLSFSPLRTTSLLDCCCDCLPSCCKSSANIWLSARKHESSYGTVSHSQLQQNQWQPVTRMAWMCGEPELGQHWWTASCTQNSTIYDRKH